ncbi:TRP1 [Symbiodinium microadriaticum]|nr:TRP1 [Symbiodinium microadriaticum]
MERHGAAPVVEVGDAGPKVVKQKEGTDKNAADRLLWQPGFPETGATRPSWLSRGSTLDRLRSQARGVYKAAESGAERYTRRERPCTCPETDFESKLLTTSAEYYRSKVAGWTAACARFSKAWEALIPAALMAYCRYSCPQFLREIQRRLEDEESRLSRYLDPSSEKEFSCNALSPKPHGAVGLMVHDPLSL